MRFIGGMSSRVPKGRGSPEGHMGVVCEKIQDAVLPTCGGKEIRGGVPIVGTRGHDGLRIHLELH